MRDLAAAVLFLAIVCAGGRTIPHAATRQDAAADPRLADPEFIKLRNAAESAIHCADRVNPVALQAPKPRYPDALVRAKIQGTAITEGIILVNGTIKYTRLVRATEPEFGKSALEVLSKYRYKPATCGGSPVPTVTTQVHTFSVR
jgi:TonB family protein